MRLPTFVAAAVITLALTAAPRRAHAEFGVGLFIGDPIGLTLKFDLQRRTAIEFLLGEKGYNDQRWNAYYGHVTFLVTPFVGRGRSVKVPFRLGIGAAIYDDGGCCRDDVNLGVRAPLQVAFRFRVPLELYFELALLFTFLDGNDDDRFLELDGGIGMRVYF